MSDQTTTTGYYARPILKEPVWTWVVPTYFFLGGLASGSACLAFGAELTGHHELSRRASYLSAASLLPCPPLLIADLGRKRRFLNMLRVFRPTSPMSMGTWVISGFGAVTSVAVLSRVTGLLRPAGRAAQAAGALLGLPLATYTAVLVSDTSVPVWQLARPHLPFVFAGSAMASAGSAAGIVAPQEEAGPARRLAMFGAGLELGAVLLMERQLGEHAKPYQEGDASLAARGAKALTGIGGGVVGLAGRHRLARTVGGCMVLAGSLLERFAVLRAGPDSARRTGTGATVKAGL